MKKIETEVSPLALTPFPIEGDSDAFADMHSADVLGAHDAYELEYVHTMIQRLKDLRKSIVQLHHAIEENNKNGTHIILGNTIFNV
jgi:hypothetical protein